MPKVLIIDDQENQRVILSKILIAERKVTVLQASNVDEAIKQIRENKPEVVLTDLKMPEKGGLDLLEELNGMSSPPEVIVITAFGSIETAVRATRLGAYDYLSKPVKPDEVLFLIDKAYEKYLLRQESRILKQELLQEVSLKLIAQSNIMLNVRSMIERVAPTDSTVLIKGETGTGKECAARLIHLLSKRGGQPMKSINCAAFAETILDSELFGYEKGAFTGAAARKTGIIEAASNGTLFLDEIGDMSPGTQAKILRVIQEKKIRRVGGTEDIPVDIRIIAATNRNLEEAIIKGGFREDLYYRLNVVPIVIPALRERKEDIPVLITHFLSKYSKVLTFDPESMQYMTEYGWPGNVRELEAVIERISIFSNNEIITAEDLPPEITKQKTLEANSGGDFPEDGIVFDEWERSLLSKALKKANGNMAAAAKLLGMSYRAFRYRANAFGLRED